MPMRTLRCCDRINASPIYIDWEKPAFLWLAMGFDPWDLKQTEREWWARQGSNL